ncbi:MAG: 30S ribosomal protein S15 [Erysipelotrichaceae bacterium]|jgi:small subunit ribosomal protein S15|nr:30S ribosomal protein S15 [Erysipelotrichaceae bacterium]
MAVSKKTKAEIIVNYGENAKDTGSMDVQVALLTEKIKVLSEHLKNNDKDHVARRSLLVYVGKRKSLLAYLEKSNRDEYMALISKLGLRK